MLVPVFVFIFGLLMGSFLNVVTLRYNSGMGIGGRSRCFSCGEALRARDLIPVLSFLAYRGSCRHCGSRISLQYPIVELLTAVGFVLIAQGGMPLAEMVFAGAIFWILLGIAVYDMRHTIIPDGAVWTFVGLAFASNFVSFAPLSLHAAVLSELLSGVAVAVPIFLLWAVSKGRWIGLGDAKLALGAGWLLGLSGGLSALVFSFWIGAAVSVLLLASRPLIRKSKLNSHLKELTMKSEIPFAPFLILGTLLVYLFGLDLAWLFIV